MAMGVVAVIFIHFLVTTNQMKGLLNDGITTTVFGNTENEANSLKEILNTAPSHASNRAGETNDNNSNNNHTNTDEWNLILVNKQHYLNGDFQVELKTLSSGHQVDKRAYDELQCMMNDARDAGLKPMICSSYRTIQKQTTLYHNKVKSYEREGYSKDKAKEIASFWVAIPGTSEHQTRTSIGYCIC